MFPVLAVAGLSLLDIWLSGRVIKKIGLVAELDPVIRKLVPRIGLYKSLLIGILVWSILISGTLVLSGLFKAAYFYLGWKTAFSALQVYSFLDGEHK